MSERVCPKCQRVMLSKRVAHPIHDGPFPLSGSGRVHYETVWYCGDCDREPPFHGAPLAEDPSDAFERDLLRRLRKP